MACFGIIEFFSMAFSACDSDYLNVRKQLSTFESSAIVLPTEMLLIAKGRVTTVSDQNIAKTFFIYFESVDCSDCLSGQLASFSRIITLAQENGLQVKCIISPRLDEAGELIKKLTELHNYLDLYVDVSSSFHELNPNLPYDKRFYLFCTDKDGKPFFVGNPCIDKHNYKLFIKSLKKSVL